MSVQIFYEIKALRVPGNAMGHDQDLYILCFLSGDSRTYNWENQRERKWSTPVIGTYDDVFAHQLTWVHYECYWKNNGASGCIRDYQWLAKVRKALDTADAVDPLHLDAVDGLAAANLTLRPHRRCEGMTVRQAITHSLFERQKTQNQGNSDWDCLRVSGPGSN